MVIAVCFVLPAASTSLTMGMRLGNERARYVPVSNPGGRSRGWIQIEIEIKLAVNSRTVGFREGAYVGLLDHF